MSTGVLPAGTVPAGASAAPAARSAVPTGTSAAPVAAPRRFRRDSVRRWMLAGLGCVLVGIGTLGIFLPGLPTTVFLLAASWLFAKSCPRLERALHAHRWFGPYLTMAANGMPRRAKVITLAAMWTGIAVSLWLLEDLGRAAQGTVLALGVVGTAVVIRFVPVPPAVSRD